jgi:hypothetical protein
MDNILVVLFTAFAILSSPIQAAEKKKVCHEETDKKGKKKEVCKEIKVHKKLEGTTVPDGKKK